MTTISVQTLLQSNLPPGPSGYSGISGFSGVAGATGTSGYSGETGAVGTSGYSGEIGISGYSGQIGATGTSGYSGETGAVGTSGYSGAVGTSGYSGAVGTSGYSGNVTNATFLQAGTGAVPRTVQSKLQDEVSVKDFGAVGDGVTDDYAAIQAAINSGARRILFPGGKYICNSTLTITGVRGLILEGDGAALLAGGTGYTGTTEIIFDGAPSGSDGIVLTDFIGVSIENMLIRMRRGGAGGGKALYLYNGHDYNLKNLKVDLSVGASGAGIVLGNGSGATSTFVGHIQNCKVMAGASCPGIYANFGTSLTFTACYVIGGWMQIDGMVYTSVISCAVDASPLYGYLINGSSNLVFDACGAEGATKGAFYLSTTTTNVVFNAPYGAANNTSGDATIGDLFQIDSSAGAVNSITINNPTSVSPNVATAQNIWASAGTGFVEVLNTDATLLSQGINGNGTWKLTKLTVTGYWNQLQSWTPTLIGWTNTGTPTVTGKYLRQGNIVTFYVRVTPATDISCTKVSSTIAGLPFTSVVAGNAVMTDGNANSYGACAIGPSGIVYPQTSGVLTVEIVITGTIFI